MNKNFDIAKFFVKLGIIALALYGIYYWGCYSTIKTAEPKQTAQGYEIYFGSVGQTHSYTD